MNYIEVFKDSDQFLQLAPDYLVPKYKFNRNLYRYDRMEDRYYFLVNENGANSFISITSLANKMVQKGPGYYKWLLKPGAMDERAEKAEYGTLFHILCMKLLLNNAKDFDFDQLKYWMRENVDSEYKDKCMIGDRPGKWVLPFKKGIHCWMQFVQDRIEEVVAVEIPLVSMEYGVACTADIVAYIRFNRKLILAGIDIKSFLFEPDEVKAKTFFETHEFQLAGIQEIWNENFEEKIEGLFNWSPTNFLTENPGVKYHFQNQGDPKKNKYLRNFGNGMTNIQVYLKLAKTMGFMTPPSTMLDIKGKVKDLQSFDWSSHTLKVNLLNK